MWRKAYLKYCQEKRPKVFLGFLQEAGAPLSRQIHRLMRSSGFRPFITSFKTTFFLSPPIRHTAARLNTWCGVARFSLWSCAIRCGQEDSQIKTFSKQQQLLCTLNLEDWPNWNRELARGLFTCWKGSDRLWHFPPHSSDQFCLAGRNGISWKSRAADHRAGTWGCFHLLPKAPAAPDDRPE